MGSATRRDDKEKEERAAAAAAAAEESPDEDFKEEADDSEAEAEAEDARDVGKSEELDEDEAADLERDLGEDLRAGKRRKRGEETGNIDDKDLDGSQGGDEKRKKAAQGAEEAWRSMKEGGLAQKATETENAEAGASKEEMVTVVKTFKFAGEEVREEKVLPASHPDAVAFLKKQKDGRQSSGTGFPSAQAPASSSNADATPAATTDEGSRVGGGKPPPGPRRKRGGGLAAMSAAASADKPTKINTLEKSKMDWDRFKGTTPPHGNGDGDGVGNDGLTERERDEMESQTKGGSSGLGSMKGYMERRGFLDRVEERLQNKDR